MQTVLFHFGMIIAGLRYSLKGQFRMDDITVCSPYGASTPAHDGMDGHRGTGENQLEGARFQGCHVAQNAKALTAGRQIAAT